MGMQKIERLIFAELKELRPNAKWKDVMEWSSGDVEAKEGEEQLTTKSGWHIALLKPPEKK